MGHHLRDIVLKLTLLTLAIRALMQPEDSYNNRCEYGVDSILVFFVSSAIAYFVAYLINPMLNPMRERGLRLENIHRVFKLFLFTSLLILSRKIPESVCKFMESDPTGDDLINQP